MAKAARTVRIHRPAQEVFDFLADAGNNRLWQPTVRPGGGTGAGGVGTVVHQSMRHPLGFRVSADYRITAYAPPTTLAYEGTGGGPFHPTGTYTLTRVDDDTTDVAFALTVAVSGVALLVSPVLMVLFRWEVGWITRAKAVLEATPGLSRPAAPTSA